METLLLLGLTGCGKPPSAAPPSFGRYPDLPVYACLRQAKPPSNCPPGMLPVPDGKPTLRKELHDIRAFCIDRLEVTLGAYKDCVSHRSCRPPHPPPYPYMGTIALTSGRSACEHPPDTADRDLHPAHCVDYYDAAAYCAYAHKRLPTEEEWQFAARGCDNRPYPWGDEPPTPARAVLETGDSAPVGGRPAGASPFGAVDMWGNVEEWVIRDPPLYDPDDPLTSLHPGVKYHALIEGISFRYQETKTNQLEMLVLGEKLPAMDLNRAGLVVTDYSSPGVGFRCAAAPSHEPMR